MNFEAIFSQSGLNTFYATLRYSITYLRLRRNGVVSFIIISIQGLDGKHTQMIRDGFPLCSGFSGGLGLLQIAPLDLKQVEVIKGSSSMLYGGGAIAGLVNLVSKHQRTKDIWTFY